MVAYHHAHYQDVSFQTTREERPAAQRSSPPGGNPGPGGPNCRHPPPLCFIQLMHICPAAVYFSSGSKTLSGTPAPTHPFFARVGRAFLTARDALRQNFSKSLSSAFDIYIANHHANGAIPARRRKWSNFSFFLISFREQLRQEKPA